MDNYQPSEVELEILQILWEHQPTTVRFVLERMNVEREKPYSYTTILTYFQRMAKKNIVSFKKQGKTHYYTAIPQEEEVKRNLSQRLLDNVFKGSAKKMLMHALGQKQVSQEELNEIQQWLETKKKENE